MTNWNVENINRLRAMLEDGKTLEECGIEFGTTRQGIRYVKNKYLPNIELKSRRVRKEQKEQKQEERRDELRRRFGRETYRCNTDLQRAQSAVFRRKRSNVAKKNRVDKLEFTINPTDIEWPTHCPILGIPLDWFNDTGSMKDDSPSFDRIDPFKGYVPGNVMIMSWRANRIKNDGTADEHERIAKWLRGLHEA